MKNRLNALLLLAVLGLSVTSAAAESPKPAASQDPVLSAMQTEMDRSKSQLKLEDVPAPYYLDYRITDIDTVDAQATFGAVRGEVRTPDSRGASGGPHRRLQAGQLLQPGRGRRRFCPAGR